MGVQNLIKNVEKKYPKVKKTVNIRKFKGCRVAIDLPILYYKYFSTNYDEIIKRINPFNGPPDEDGLIKKVVNQVVRILGYHFLSNDIIPIIVVEGESSDDKKDNTGERRKEQRKKQAKKLKKFLEKYKGGRTDDDEAEYMDKFDELRSLYRYSSYPSKKLVDTLIEKLKEKNYTVIYAKGEAEELCTEMCKEGIVQAVYSTDSDNLVRKCPICITKIWRDSDNDVFKADLFRYSDEIPAAFGFDYKTFVDYCIMLGCDYNTRIYRMQEKKIIELLTKYGSLERIERKTDLDVEQLNYKRCRKIFNIKGRLNAADYCKDVEELEVLCS